jgi:multidrug efflux pump subunit AcrB
MAFVSTVLPGASPESVEDLVTKKIEKEISKVK